MAHSHLTAGVAGAHTAYPTCRCDVCGLLLQIPLVMPYYAL